LEPLALAEIFLVIAIKKSHAPKVLLQFVAELAESISENRARATGRTSGMITWRRIRGGTELAPTLEVFVATPFPVTSSPF
jgi:hypothetical protein